MSKIVINYYPSVSSWDELPWNAKGDGFAFVGGEFGFNPNRPQAFILDNGKWWRKPINVPPCPNLAGELEWNAVRSIEILFEEQRRSGIPVALWEQFEWRLVFKLLPVKTLEGTWSIGKMWRKRYRLPNGEYPRVWRIDERHKTRFSDFWYRVYDPLDH